MGHRVPSFHVMHATTETAAHSSLTAIFHGNPLDLVAFRGAVIVASAPLSVGGWDDAPSPSIPRAQTGGSRVCRLFDAVFWPPSAGGGSADHRRARVRQGG